MSIGADGASSSLAGCVLRAGNRMVAEGTGCATGIPACCEMAAESLSTSGTPSFTGETMGWIFARIEAGAWRSSARRPCASRRVTSANGEASRAQTALCSAGSISSLSSRAISSTTSSSSLADVLLWVHTHTLTLSHACLHRLGSNWVRWSPSHRILVVFAVPGRGSRKEVEAGGRGGLSGEEDGGIHARDAGCALVSRTAPRAGGHESRVESRGRLRDPCHPLL
ncbi:unnamed protein product [Lampetra fluviatilis]